MINTIKQLIKKIIYLIKLIIGFWIFVFIFIISKFILIRVYYLRSHRIGHLVEDYYLYSQIKKKKNTIDLFYFNAVKGNIFLINYIKNNNFVFSQIILEPVYLFIILISNKFHFFKKYLAYKKYHKKENYEYIKNKNVFKFSKKETDLGEKYLSKINVNKKKIVCINISNLDHLSKYKKRDWNYQNFRKSNIKDYEVIIKYLIKKNYLVIRTGHSSKPYKNTFGKNFFDYAFKERNDFLDIYLMSKCNLYISNSTGLDYLAFAFNIPMFINVPVIDEFFIEKVNTMYLLKQYKSTETKKKLNIEEIFSRKIIFSVKGYFFKQNKIEIIPNSKKQLLNGIKDMMMILKTKSKIKKKLVDKNNKFWNLFKKNLNTKKNKKNKNYYLKNEFKAFYSWSNINF